MILALLAYIVLKKNAFPHAVWQLFKYTSNHSSPELRLGEKKKDTAITTPPRTPRISGLKSQVLRPTFLG